MPAFTFTDPLLHAAVALHAVCQQRGTARRRLVSYG